MKKTSIIIISILVVLVIAFYVIFSNQSNSTPVAVAPGTPTDTSTTTTSNASTTTTSTTVMGSRNYKDGSYTGSIADAIYGKLQVAITVSGGKLTNVTWPIYPSEGGETTQVSNRALPILKQEAITTQNSNVNIVSGATQTSQAFQQSLASALSQAQS